MKLLLDQVLFYSVRVCPRLDV